MMTREINIPNLYIYIYTILHLAEVGLCQIFGRLGENLPGYSGSP